jgi:branched-subunit amino acid ABC-type transport system permease component
MSQFVSVLLTGIAYGVPVFLVASGLTLIYGVIGVLNFAHGAFFVLGALLTAGLLGGSVPGVAAFVLAVAAGGLLAAGVGLLTELTVVRRLYHADHITMLLGTYAVLLTIEGAAEVVWGTDIRSQRQPEPLAGDVRILGAVITVYDLALVAVGAAVAAGLWLLINRSRSGRAIRAIAQDSTMAQAMGINSKRVLLVVFGLGSCLAGLAGGLMAPNVSVSPSLGNAFILQCFVVVIVGGLGSIEGALVASLLVGVAETAAVAYLPELTGFTFYILVAVVLVLRPQGLLGNARARSAS